jgi:Uma2 family endonuclease
MLRPRREKIGDADPSGLRFAAVDVFLNWHERQEARYELVGGRPMMQAGATRAHERIVKNVFRELERQLDPDRYDVNKSDFAVRIDAEDGLAGIRYPDIVVDEQTAQGKDLIAVNPVVVVEVLSRSTEKVDLEIKPQEYGSNPSLLCYIVFDSQRPVAQVWRRDQESGWPPKPRRIDTGEIAISELNVVLKMDAVFQGIRAGQGRVG